MLEEMEIPPCILHCTDIGCTERLHHDAINDICNNLIDMCLVAGGHCFPRLKAGVKGKPGWNSSVKGLRTDSLFWHSVRLFGSTTRVTRVSLTDMRNIKNPALQAERFVLLSDTSNLFYQGHIGLRSHTVRCQ